MSKRQLVHYAVADAFASVDGFVVSVDLHQEVVGSAAEVSASVEPWRRAGAKVDVFVTRPGVIRVIVDGATR